MVSEKFPQGLRIKPVVNGATEVFPRIPSSDGWWEWPNPSTEFIGGRLYRFSDYTMVNVLVTADGSQQIIAPGLVEVSREIIGSGPNSELIITFRREPHPSA